MQVFTMKPVLAALDWDKEFRVEANVSNYATGGVLSMKCSDKKWRLVTFISKSLSDTEQNYEIHDERVQKGIAYWDKQNNDVLVPNCMLKVWGEIIKVEGL